VRVLINAVSIKEGGSLVVLTKLLFAMLEAQPNIEWIVAAHPTIIPVGENARSAVWLPLGEVQPTAFHILKWYELELPAIVKNYRPDVLFSQTNYLPRRALACPTLLLLQNAGYFSAEFDRLTMARLNTVGARLAWRQKCRWARQSVKTATMLAVQTAALAESVNMQTGRPRDQITVIPHGPGLAVHRRSPRPERRGDQFRIGYVTKWGVQKNFDTLFKAAQKLQKESYHFKIILTLDKSSRETNETMAMARNLGIEALIENYGEVAFDDVSAIYDGLDMFVFASVCESFGFPTVEAMARGLPIITARTKENAEVTRGAALEFSPDDADALASHLATMMNDDQERAKRANLSLVASRRYSWENAARETIAALDALATKSARNASSVNERVTLQRRTAAHYDFYPFEFLTPKDETSIEKIQPEPFRRFVNSHVEQGAKIADIGCGPGRGTLYLAQRGGDVVGVDISLESLLLARGRAPAAKYVVSTNLALPFVDGCFEIVISDGVIHHTPDARFAFAEIARITKTGGHCYLAVYRKWGYYYFVYTFIGVPIRWLEKLAFGRKLLFATLVPLYWIVHLIKSGGTRSWRGAVNFFYDYIITPRASFHTYEEILRWATKEGFKLSEYEPRLGNVHVFVFRKKPPSRACSAESINCIASRN
jgi:glycosyltransferase involved in cell wall biosynthesis/ubiquinone/menaquinone biosynthesis C-methylase UbiE